MSKSSSFCQTQASFSVGSGRYRSRFCNEHSDALNCFGMLSSISPRVVRVAKVAELADAPDLGSGTERCGGSSPPFRTISQSAVSRKAVGRKYGSEFKL